MKSKQFISLILLLFLIGVLALVTYFARSQKKVAEYRSKAAGEISVSLSSSPDPVVIGVINKATVAAKLKNVTGNAISGIMQMGTIKLNFDKSIAGIFTVAQADIHCDPFFSSLVASEITNSSISLTCAQMGAMFSLANQEEKTFATIDLNLATSQPNTVGISVAEVIIPKDQANMGGNGSGVNIQIKLAPTLTPTPTNTPTPTKTPTPSNTPTPTPTSTNTPTPTITPTPTPVCPRGNEGNLNCSVDRIINIWDLAIMSEAWGVSPVPTPVSGKASADISSQQSGHPDGIVNIWDLEKMSTNWGM